MDLMLHVTTFSQNIRGTWKLAGLVGSPQAGSTRIAPCDHIHCRHRTIILNDQTAGGKVLKDNLALDIALEYSSSLASGRLDSGHK